ncbi:MAG TPA: hypothetical protein VJL29_02775 [Thermoguttaceae bacterium]|nr:hypothetical protein [Thermoguttaceae bacterium]
MEKLLKVGAVATCLVGLILCCWAGCMVKTPAPDSYVPYTAKDGSFQCDRPDGWTPNEGKNPRHNAFSLGNAEIRIEVSPLDALHLDQTADKNATTNNSPPDVEKPAAPRSLAAQAHEAKRKIFNDFKVEYDERDPTVVQTGLGDACRSEFTASDRLIGPVHGYRVTVPVGDQYVHVVCACPESDWPTLRPAFNHVIASLRPAKNVD